MGLAQKTARPRRFFFARDLAHAVFALRCRPSLRRAFGKKKPALARPQRVPFVSQVLAVPTIANRFYQELCEHLNRKIL
jgi:hypothetical protein